MLKIYEIFNLIKSLLQKSQRKRIIQNRRRALGNFPGLYEGFDLRSERDNCQRY